MIQQDERMFSRHSYLGFMDMWKKVNLQYEHLSRQRLHYYHIANCILAVPCLFPGYS